MKSKTIVAVFAALLALLAASNIFYPKKEFSDNENRTLATFPKVSFETIKSGKFTSGFGTYISDHFIFRDGFVTIKTLADLALLKTDSGGVTRVKDGDIRYLIDMFTQSDVKNFDKNLEAAKELTRLFEDEYGVRTRTLIVPTAAYVMKEKLPRFNIFIDEEPLLERLRELDGFVDVSGALRENSDEYIFFRTDHHWTAWGAYYGYREYEKSIRLIPAEIDDIRFFEAERPFYGTTYSRFGLFDGFGPDGVFAPGEEFFGEVTVTNQKGETRDSLYAPDKAEGKDKYLFFLGGNEPLLTIETKANTGRRLLLIKDSFANAFIPFIARDFDKITVVDMRYYPGKVADLAKDCTDALVLYQLKFFAENTYFSLAPLT